MTRAEICAALDDWLFMMRGDEAGDQVADLMALAWPNDPPAPSMGFGDPIERIRPGVEVLLHGWSYILKSNHAPPMFRERDRAVRALLEMVG